MVDQRPLSPNHDPTFSAGITNAVRHWAKNAARPHGSKAIIHAGRQSLDAIKAAIQAVV